MLALSASMLLAVGMALRAVCVLRRVRRDLDAAYGRWEASHG